MKVHANMSTLDQLRTLPQGAAVQTLAAMGCNRKELTTVVVRMKVEVMVNTAEASEFRCLASEEEQMLAVD